LHELGWADLLEAAPDRGAGITFTLLGWTGAAAALLDDVVLHALGLPVSLDTCAVLPLPHSADLPSGAGLVSSRIERAARVLVPVHDGVVEMEPSAVEVSRSEGIDPAGAYRRVRVELPAPTSSVFSTPPWASAVRAARVALAAQLIGASRRMLDLARTHAIERVQFGRPVASFQAVRHKLADALVAIEAADGVCGAAVESGDDLTATLAKSLAGRAARVTATHTQQVLAGIGFTTEHPFHLFFKRTMVLDTLFGSARTLPVEIGHLLLAARTAPRLIDL
jgi:hypothetical protein